MKTHWRPTHLQSGRKCLIPADRQTEAELKSWDSRVRAGELRCPRNPRFHRLAHAIGGMVAENVDDFEGMEAHAVLKRVQLETNTCCDEVAYRVNGMMGVQRVPKSISFDSMGEDEFKRVMGRLCAWLIRQYWRDCTVEEIVEMAQEWERSA